MPHLYWGQAHYYVPLYLNRREETEPPELVATLETSGVDLEVRTVLLPHWVYARARAAVAELTELPVWLLKAWAERPADADEPARAA